MGWDVAAAVFCAWMWATILPLDPEETGRRAGREDPGKAPADILLLFASVASLVAVGFLLAQAGHAKGAAEGVYVGLGFLSVVLSWCVVHTRFTLHYARLYYTGKLLWQQTLPAGGYATPCTHMVNGRQFVAFALPPESAK